MTKGNLTTKEVVDKLETLYGKSSDLIREVVSAIGKLDEIREELRGARTVYEKSLFFTIKEVIEKNPKTSIWAIVISVFIIISSITCFLITSDNLKARAGSIQIEKISQDQIVK